MPSCPTRRSSTLQVTVWDRAEGCSPVQLSVWLIAISAAKSSFPVSRPRCCIKVNATGIDLAATPNKRRAGAGCPDNACKSSRLICEVVCENVFFSPCSLSIGESISQLRLATEDTSTMRAVRTDPKSARLPLFHVFFGLKSESSDVLQSRVAVTASLPVSSYLKQQYRCLLSLTSSNDRGNSTKHRALCRARSH